MTGKRKDYIAELLRGFWNYQQARFAGKEGCFDPAYKADENPPVFLVEEAWQNVICEPGKGRKEAEALIALVPTGERHKWFRSMSSSQALAQSILGNLKVHNQVHILSELEDDDTKGLRLLGHMPVTSEQLVMEHAVRSLGEPHPTTLDAYFAGEYRITVECKFSEGQFTPCSRPRLKEGHALYETEYCNGDYPSRPMRSERCPLITKGVKYWEYIPYIFNLDRDGYYRPCPLNENYQLFRIILAAGTTETSVTARNGHAVLFYDARNPAFQPGGKVDRAYKQVKKSLKVPGMVRRCSWQKVTALMRDRNVLPWLTQELRLKYGV